MACRADSALPGLAPKPVDRSLAVRHEVAQAIRRFKLSCHSLKDTGRNCPLLTRDPQDGGIDDRTAPCRCTGVIEVQHIDILPRRCVRVSRLDVPRLEVPESGRARSRRIRGIDGDCAVGFGGIAVLLPRRFTFAAETRCEQVAVLDAPRPI